MENFILEIPFKTADYLIKNEKPNIEQKKGLIILELKLDEKKNDIISLNDDEV